LLLCKNAIYKIEFITSGTKKTGYVQSIYIYIPTKNSGSSTGATPTPTPAPTSKPSATPTPAVNNNADFESNLKEFPASYRDALIKLHEVYPNWVFKAYDTGKDWSEVIEAESKVGKNLVPNTKSMEWLSMETGAYSWETDTFQPFDGKTWVTASEEAVKYYMDPRNFLTTSGIFQFELLKYQSGYQNISGVNNMLKGTALYASEYSYQDENGNTASYSYAETFMKAAKYSGVSPYHLASRVKQEVVTGITTLSSSVSGTYPGYEGYYNFYNIGASDSAGGGAVAKGLKFAMSGVSSAEKNAQYLIPWSNPYRSIVGGAYYLGSNYISRGQDTIYLQKFNVTPTTTYYHQYMSNLEAPYAEGKKVLAAYSGLLDSSIIFSIPVYDNMPKTVCSIPAVEYNPNNRMKDLKVFTLSGRELTKTPSFSQTVKNYDLIVDNSIDSVQIAASSVSKKATISGTGTVSLKVGTNKIVVSVKAQNGDVAKYTVTIVRSEHVATPTPSPTSTPAATKTPTQSPTQSASQNTVQ
jgi:beta-N-acetylglucosaminidase